MAPVFHFLRDPFFAFVVSPLPQALRLAALAAALPFCQFTVTSIPSFVKCHCFCASTYPYFASLLFCSLAFSCHPAHVVHPLCCHGRGQLLASLPLLMLSLPSIASSLSLLFTHSFACSLALLVLFVSSGLSAPSLLDLRCEPSISAFFLLMLFVRPSSAFAPNLLICCSYLLSSVSNCRQLLAAPSAPRLPAIFLACPISFRALFQHPSHSFVSVLMYCFRRSLLQVLIPHLRRLAYHVSFLPFPLLLVLLLPCDHDAIRPWPISHCSTPSLQIAPSVGSLHSG